MADPLHVLHSLRRLSDKYTVFEPDQVLTHGQLNSLSDWLDDQDRLSRVDLLGVGIVSGLRVGRRDAGVRVTRGLGVTTDGDLLRLPQERLYDRFRPYDRSAPVYEPFYRRRADGDGAPQMIELVELVAADETDPGAAPLSQLPRDGLAGKVVLMLMESVVNDPDLCTGTDCDNLGRDALHRVRLLLIDAADAQELAARGTPLRPASARAAALPEALAERPVLGRDIGSTGLLAERCRAAAKGTLRRLVPALEALASGFPELLDELFGRDPSAEWRALLEAHAARFDAGASGHQIWLDALKDLVDTYNAARDALLADDAVPLPDPEAFPKHLLLGRVDAPRVQRMGLFPSPLDALAREQAARARFAVWKLHVLLQSFEPPTDTELRITPSRGEQAPLEERAIPWHYRLRDDLPVHVGWNYRLSAREQPHANLGYRAREWRGSERALDPLQFGIAAHDFFRIEGHLGRPVQTVVDELKARIAAHNLPFEVQAVLLHNDKRHIRVKPGIRYTDLHRLHYLVRKDVAFRLEESQAFGQRFLDDVTQAVATKQIVGSGDTGESAIGIARGARDAVRTAQQDATPVLTSAKYSAYRANPAWKSAFASSVESVGNARVNLGHVARSDFTSAFDSLIATNQPHWIDWLDDLIVAGDGRADDKLLFGAFVQQHPGLDHLGGVWRGGSFVLAYDDSGRVVADFTLPYPCAEVDDDEPEEPPLQRPPYRPPAIVDKPIRLLRPLDLTLDDKIFKVREVFQKDLQVQTANVEGLVKGAFLPQPPKVSRLDDLKTGDLVLDDMLRGVESKRQQVERLREGVVQPETTPEARLQIEQRLRTAEAELATEVTQATERAVTQNLDLRSGASAEATKVLTGGVTAIRDTQATATLKTGLARVEGGAVGTQKDLVVAIQSFGGFRR